MIIDGCILRISLKEVCLEAALKVHRRLFELQYISERVSAASSWYMADLSRTLSLRIDCTVLRPPIFDLCQGLFLFLMVACFPEYLPVNSLIDEIELKPGSPTRADAKCFEQSLSVKAKKYINMTTFSKPNKHT